MQRSFLLLLSQLAKVPYFAGSHWGSIADSIGVPLGFHWGSAISFFGSFHLRYTFIEFGSNVVRVALLTSSYKVRLGGAATIDVSGSDPAGTVNGISDKGGMSIAPIDTYLCTSG